ncbi:MAG TPA: class I SAM-dependent methyltransferase [Burkholderiales bacterium]|nr:class I SAM-dependent methyltransferase [Burkholderiales bacterium]
MLNRRGLFKGIALFAAGFASKWLGDRYAGDEAPIAPAPHQPPAASGDMIDVAEFKKTTSVEALNQTAETYFARLPDWDFQHAKPLANPKGAPDLLTGFAHVLHGLQVEPGMSVLDFGAGSCWASRWLTQMGLEAIALDVSPSALKIGQALYQRLPVIGERPKPRFLLFDGQRIDLPDASVDRIMCLDAFHHVLNQDQVLQEMRRVLKPAGIAGFSEPGPYHSRTAQSQHEMRNFKVLEDDVHIDRIWAAAQRAGFARMRLALLNVPSYLVTFEQFEEFLAGGKMMQHFAEAVRAQMLDRRMFFLQKGGTAPSR